MLIVTARNLSNLAPKSDYEVCVRVNHRVLWQGTVRAHIRSSGWGDLLRAIAAAAEAPKEEK